MFVPLQDAQKERTRGDKNYLVDLHLLTILTGQGHISKLIVLSQVSNSQSDIAFEIVPLQTMLFISFSHLFLSKYSILFVGQKGFCQDGFWGGGQTKNL